MNDRINICTIFSPNWMHYFHVFLYSLFKNNKSPIKVYLLSDGMSETDKQKATNICEYFGEGYKWEYIDVSKLYNTFMINNKNVDSRFTKYTLFKILIPYIISDDKLLFLDGDTIALSDISEFYNQNMKGLWMSGCIDTGINDEYKKSIGMNPKDIYLNAGVLKFDLNKIRESKIADTWMDWVNNQFFPCHEQCIFNKSLAGKIQVVSPKYNVSLSTSLNFRPEEIKILHMAGVKNPWIKDIPFSELWYEVEKEYNTIFQNYKPKPRIPKIIHACWFGKNKMPQIIQNYLSTWKEKCLDYEIKIWDETNFDINKYEYTKQAYKAKKYAFVSDVAKLEALIQYGGIALDMDIEILRSFDDFIHHRCFTGYQENFMITAVLGAEKNHPYIQYLLSYYNNRNFVEKPNTYIIDEMAKKWLVEKDSNITWLKESVAIYPEEIFCPYSHAKMKPLPTEKSYTIHHFTATWKGRTKVMSDKFKIDLQDIFDESIYWQMNISEKSSMLYLIEKLKEKNIAIEVGSYRGGSLLKLDKYFKKVYSCDIDHNLLTNKSIYKNVEYIAGDSKNTLPKLIDNINNSNEVVNFILIDADHEYNGVKKDIENILKIKPKDDLIILIHDSWYSPSRSAIIDSNWKSNPYVHYIDTDFVAGDLCYSGMYDKDILIGGLALIIMSPKIREDELIIKQSQDKLYCRISKLI